MRKGVHVRILSLSQGPQNLLQLSKITERGHDRATFTHLSPLTLRGAYNFLSPDANDSLGLG